MVLYTKRVKREAVRPSCTFNHDPRSVVADVTRYCRSIARLGINITDGYHNWFEVGASLASLGEEGREFFHMVSRFNPKYSSLQTDKMFSSLLRRNPTRFTIVTFFYHCKQYGLQLTCTA
ncbi:MAG: PriCT-2 domain-containing protein [Muribaculaceae bacterium]|nr:PriCT-2 domain-containing protein [Muribaculaceae bacterium]